MKSLRSALALVCILSAGLGPARAAVLIAGGPNDLNWNNDVQATLVGTGLISGSVDIFDITGGTPTLAQLSAYDAVLFYTDGVGMADRDAMGDVLADYVDAGGGVVEAVFSFHDDSGLRPGGRWESGLYPVWPPAAQASSANLTLGTVHVLGHPILNGVGSFDGGSSSYHHTPVGTNPGVTPVADWSNGEPLVAVNTGTFAGMVVGLNFFPPSSDARGDFWLASTDGGILMANALNFAAGQAAQPIPEPGTLALLGLGLVALRRRRR